MDLAIKDVQRHVGKFIATIIGVGLLMSIVLIMNGIYQGNTSDGIWLIDNTATDLWVVENGRGGPFNEQSRIAEESWESVAAIPGIEKASPFISYTVQRSLAGREQHFTIIGYDVFGGLGGPGRIVAGKTITQAHYEAVADMKTGLKLGERFRIGVHDYTVVGLTRKAVDAAGNPLLYLSLPDAQEVLYDQDNRARERSIASETARLIRAGYTPEVAKRLLPLLSAGSATVNAVLVKLRPGANQHLVVSRIERWLYFSVYTTDQQRDLMIEGKLKKMGAILGLFRLLLVIVSLVIIALLIYVLTVEKIKAIATLKLIGASNGIIVRLILEQSIVLTVSSFLFAWGVVQLTYDHFPRTLVLLPHETLASFLVFFIGGMASSLVGIVHALRTPPSLALGG
ncbi:MAG: ABC transporter permease [Chlorobium sp.]|uniref:ABC transporter permease n=1 Tax=Chlorobium sp. TaxID=1095 RepID=UPI001D401B6E|nr:ABC transporter permease [Chlorobium sp.]MBN1278968.1 ABC transporter permease [Chlorobiaceae bacterium]MCF8216620.1 ABC transporter permease [Chlorobium sp.]MCF8271490.1 ABC transporter permease [Chlorobium sp.]MCF8287862.1 ABC transporter permease [Chlorobium sp.]MCF8291449.1 ABC transporter permease [Chlorobium sp.]